jgi:hypothetical protein
MRFFHVLPAVIALLQREGRVTYSALQYEFGFDEAFLHVLKRELLGDGLLVYFGWPQAHEDAASRAVHTGLGIIDAMQTLNARLETEHGVRLAVRIGLHTGPVVVGEMGGGDRYERLALGDTPNIAARLQAFAAPDTVAISAVTARLVQGTFVLEITALTRRCQHPYSAVGSVKQWQDFLGGTRNDCAVAPYDHWPLHQHGVLQQQVNDCLTCDIVGCLQAEVSEPLVLADEFGRGIRE